MNYLKNNYFIDIVDDFNNDVVIHVYNDINYDIIDIYDVVDLILFLGDDLGNVSVYNVVNNLS